MAEIAFVAATENGTSSASPGSVTWASTTAGHFLLLAVGFNTDTTDVKHRQLYADGWTLLVVDSIVDTNKLSLAVYWKFATGSESGSYSIPLYSGTGIDMECAMAAWSGVDPTYPIGEFAEATQGAGVVDISAPSINCYLDRSVAVRVIWKFANNNTFTFGGGFTKRLDAGQGTVKVSIGVADLAKNAGNVAAGSATPSGGTTTLGAGLTLILNPDYASSLHHTDYLVPASMAAGETVGGTVWQNPTNVAADDNSRSQAGSTGPTTAFITDYLKCLDFSVKIPPGSSVVGIEAKVIGRFYFTSATSGDATRLAFVSASLYRASSLDVFSHVWTRAFSGIFQSSPTSSSPADQSVTIGGPGCIWTGSSTGTTWTRDDVKDTGFGVGVFSEVTSNEDPSAGNNIVQIDQVAVRVWFIPPIPVECGV